MREPILTTARPALATACNSFILIGAAERLLPLALHPLSAPGRTLLVLVALLLPAVVRRADDGRGRWLAGSSVAACAGLAVAGITGSVLALAGGSLWLALAPRTLPPRALAAGLALGLALLPFHARVLESDALRVGVAVAGVLLAATAAAAAPPPGPAGLERRARAFRWRGVVALGALAFLDALLRRELLESGPAPLWPAALTGLAVAAYVAYSPAAQPRRRPALLVLAGIAAAAALASSLGDIPPLLLATRGVLMLLAARAVVPVAARRPRLLVPALWLVWLAGAALAAAVGAGPAAALAALVALLALALLPRPAAWRELS